MYDSTTRLFFREASAAASISTGKERDSESGNDYFGKRYYASSMDGGQAVKGYGPTVIESKPMPFGTAGW